MASTTPQSAPEFVKTIMDSLFNGWEAGVKEAYQMWWNALISFLHQHWVAVLITLAAVFVIALARALMGRWGMLGSVLYNYLYFGILFVVGLVWGSDVFVSDYLHLAFTAILWPVCYFLVDQILDKSGLRERRF